MGTIRTISSTLARRLAITCQYLAGPRPSADVTGILEIFRRLGYLQLDPTCAVEYSHLLVLWSRLGHYDRGQLEQLLWEERRLFEYWTPIAAIVRTADYPIFNWWMRSLGTEARPWNERYGTWLEANESLRHRILDKIRQHGPLPSRAFQDIAVKDWESTGWTAGRNVNMMLEHLWIKGEIMVVGRSGRQKIWNLAERWLPDGIPQEPLSQHEMIRRTVQKSVRALGVARPKHIQRYFLREGHQNLDQVLSELEKEGILERVKICTDNTHNGPGDWYLHNENVDLLEQLTDGKWQPCTTLLSPFDNLISDRQRTKQLFGFEFSLEIYKPKANRQYGYYVLPILHEDRFIGRIDPVMNRKQRQLVINAVYAEPDAPTTKATAQAVAEIIEELGRFLNAKEIIYSHQTPEAWKCALC